mmetsp:Transcript_28315/g.79923  ORF Transcript_28315/g.79923 Transcript_28315/m.79923 type:complete len:450 (+) Transcript_28315:204-1553(+)
MKHTCRIWVALVVTASILQWGHAARSQGRMARHSATNHLSAGGGTPGRGSNTAFSAVIDGLKPDEPSGSPAGRATRSNPHGDAGKQIIRQESPAAASSVKQDSRVNSAAVEITPTPKKHRQLQHPTGLKTGSSLRQEARAILINRAKQVAPLIDLAIYGDSIAAALSGTRAENAMKLYRERYSTEAFGVSGDRVDNLVYRLQNGELPGTMMPKTFLIWIGMNNLRHNQTLLERPLTVSASLALRREFSKEFLPIIKMLRYHSPESRILLAGILPFSSKGSSAWPNMYTKAIEIANMAMESASARDELTFFSDCSGTLLQAAGNGTMTRINQTRVPDLVLPNDEGHTAIAQCLLRSLDRMDKDLGTLHFTQPVEARQGDFSVHPGTSCDDKAVQNGSALDYRACLAMCQGFDWCRAFSFRKHSKECDLKDSCNKSKYDLKWTSGLRLDHR